MAYATTEQLARRWRSMSPGEEVVARQLLEDAQVLLDAFGATDDDGVLGIVSCNMVKRAMSDRANAFGLDNMAQDVIGWDSQAAAGELWLSTADKRLLGIQNQRVEVLEVGCKRQVGRCRDFEAC